MAKTKSIEKKEYGFLTAAQAAQVWTSAKPDPNKMVKTGDKPREKFSSTSIMSAPEVWPSLADALLMKGVGNGKELDFVKLAEHFNEIINKVNAGNLPEPKALTGGDLRKLALDLTRKRLANAKSVLATKPADVAALAKQKEALDILAKHGWDETVVKREKKENGKSKKAAKPEPKPVAVPAPEKPIEKPNVSTPESKPVTKPEPTKPERFYVKGCTPFVKDEFEKIGGGVYDTNDNKWHFPTLEKAAIAQKILDDFFAKNRKR
jgi:hypothetical protein